MLRGLSASLESFWSRALKDSLDLGWHNWAVSFGTPRLDELTQHWYHYRVTLWETVFAMRKCTGQKQLSKVRHRVMVAM